MMVNRNERFLVISIRKILLMPLCICNFFVGVYSKLLGKLRPNLSYFWLDMQVEKNQEIIRTVTHKSSIGKMIQFKLYAPNWICRFRADSFSKKEPETLEWIDEYGGDGVFFDIGANVGLYSIYYAATKQANVYAFEPSVFNLALLAKNIHINQLAHRIKMITNPLTSQNEFANFSLSSLDEGGALSAFGVDYGHDGNELKKILSYQTAGLSLDFLMQHQVLPEYPHMIKIDVDGIEDLILAGAINTLKHPTCRTVLIEVSDHFKSQAEHVKTILTDCGFSLRQKRQSEMVAAGAFSDAYNQIWVKENN